MLLTEQLVLTQTQLCELIGTKQVSKQIEWLQKHHIPFTINYKGKLNVLPECYKQLYGLKIKEKPAKLKEPRFELLNTCREK
jgi:hypothetical protein